MEKKEFIEKLVKIDQIEDSEDSSNYGHYPFQLLVETEDDKIEMNALALGGDVVSCYRRAGKYVKENAKKVFSIPGIIFNAGTMLIVMFMVITD